VAYRQHTSLSSSCSTSSLIWKLDKRLAVSNNDEDARHFLAIKLLDKLIGLEIGQVACRQHQSLSSSCSTSSLVWKLDKWLAVSTLPCHQAARQAHWSGNWTSGLPSAHFLVIKLLDKLIGLEIGQAHCRQQRRRSEKKPLSISCSTSSLVWKLDKWPAVSNNAEKAKRNACHQAARQAHWSGNWTSGLPSASSLSSSCSTSSLIWKLDKLFAVNNNEEARNSLVIKLLGKLIGLEIVHVACRRHTSLSSSCSTSSLVWKLDKLIAVNDDEEARNSLVIKRSASSLIWTLDNWLAFSINLLLPKHASSKRSNNDEEARNSLVIRLFDKLCIPKCKDWRWFGFARTHLFINMANCRA